jgi:hypothetical protein
MSINNESKFENILGDLDKNILKYKSQIPILDNTKTIKIEKSDKLDIEGEKTFYDLLSKYQLDNSNLQYENFYLKKQNKFLEEEIKKINEKYLELKKEIETYNVKLNNFDKLKEDNLKDLNDKYKKSINEYEKENTILKKDKNNFIENQSLIIQFLEDKKEILLNLGIKIEPDLNNKIDIKIFENIFNKIINENQKLNTKINGLKKIIKDFNSHLENEQDEKTIKINNPLKIENNKKIITIPEKKDQTSEQTKENSMITERYSTINKKQYQSPTLIDDIQLNNQQFNSFSPLSSNIFTHNLRINNQNNQNHFLRNISYPERKLFNDYNSFRKNIKFENKKMNYIKKERLKKNIINLKSPLYGLKNKIELLENMLKDANYSHNDNFIESPSNSHSRNYYPEMI